MVNQQALDASLAVTPLHASHLQLAKGEFACSAPEATPWVDMTYDMRCQGCVVAAIAHVRLGHNPVTRTKDARTMEERNSPLAEQVAFAIDRYDWPYEAP